MKMFNLFLYTVLNAFMLFCCCLELH